MASYGRSIVFRPSFDVEPMPEVKRAQGTTHAVNMRPLNERVWLSTESLYNKTPGRVALAKFSESLAPSVATTKVQPACARIICARIICAHLCSRSSTLMCVALKQAQHFARPKANMSAGLVNAPESEKPDYRVFPIGPANRPRPPQLSPAKF